MRPALVKFSRPVPHSVPLVQCGREMGVLNYHESSYMIRLSYVHVRPLAFGSNRVHAPSWHPYPLFAPHNP